MSPIARKLASVEYKEDLLVEIGTKIAAGKTLASIAAEHGTSERTFARLIKRTPELREAIDVGRACRLHSV